MSFFYWRRISKEHKIWLIKQGVIKTRKRAEKDSFLLIYIEVYSKKADEIVTIRNPRHGRLHFVSFLFQVPFFPFFPKRFPCNAEHIRELPFAARILI